MKIPHFFKANSRLGISNPHKFQKDTDIGVEDGPDVILTDDFLAKFPLCYTGEYIFPKPEKISPKQFNKALGDQISGFKEFINKYMRIGQTQVVIGGDHSVTLPSILAVRDRAGSFKNLGYIQFDSHGDINLKASSPTNNFHGMYARPLIDHFDIKEIENLVPSKLSVENIMYIGNLDLDQEEADLFAKKKVKNINGKALLEDKRNIVKDFSNFISSFQYLHVSFDVDVLDKTQASATGIPAENGLKLKNIKELLNIISKHPNLSFDLTEVNPRKSGMKQTLKSVHKVLLTSLNPKCPQI